MNTRQLSILRRFADGKAPRCSRMDFDELRRAVPGVLQLESVHGSDTRSGYCLTPLHEATESFAAVNAWLIALPKPEN